MAFAAEVSLTVWIVLLVWLAAAALVCVGWALHGAVTKATGETLDLSVAAARGDLNFAWDWPAEWPRITVSTSGMDAETAAPTRRAHLRVVNKA